MDEKEVSEMQEEMMTVLVVEPMKAPYVKNIPNELEDLQQAVGGDIEMTYPFDDKVGILLNGNGKFEGLPLNRALYDDRGQVYDAIAGTFLVVGLTEDDFTSLTPEQIEKFKEKYQSPEIFTLFNGELHVMKMPPEEANGTAGWYGGSKEKHYQSGDGSGNESAPATATETEKRK